MPHQQHSRTQRQGQPTGVIELDMFGSPMKLVTWQTVRLKARIASKGGRPTLFLDFGNTFGVPWAIAIPLNSSKNKSPKKVSSGLLTAKAGFLALGFCSGYLLYAVRIALA